MTLSVDVPPPRTFGVRHRYTGTVGSQGARRDSDLVVAHSVFDWLPLTMTWVYNQVRFTPRTRAVVLADARASGDFFPWDPIYTASWIDKKAARLWERIGTPHRARSFDTAIAQHHVSVLHSHFGSRGWFDLPLASSWGLAHVVSYYGYDLTLLPKSQPVWRRRYAKLFQSADLFLCEGPSMRETLVALGCPEHKVVIQRLGVDLFRLRYEPRRPPNDGVVRILIAGTFRQKKGIPLALEAVANVLEHHPSLRVTIIGDAAGQKREKAEKASILEVVSRRKLEPVVEFLGYQPYERLLAEAYRHHVFLSPSLTADDGDTEGGAPVTIVEMAATGMPIVSTRHCDIPGVVIDGVTGFLAAPGDVVDLTEKLQMALSHPADWQTMGEAGRHHIEEYFDVRELGRQLEERYRAIAHC